MLLRLLVCVSLISNLFFCIIAHYLIVTRRDNECTFYGLIFFVVTQGECKTAVTIF